MKKIMTGDKRALIDKARNVLLGQAMKSADINALCKKLEAADLFDYAAELLTLKIKQDCDDGLPVPTEEYRTLAKFIYKDNSLSSLFKFDRALQVLQCADPLAQSEDCETLGMVGAIYKRKWQFDHQYKNIVLARHYYERGFSLWKKYLQADNDPNAEHAQNDRGWNAINFAYIIELQSVNDLEETGSATGFRRFDPDGLMEAQRTRVYILEQFVDEPFASPRLRRDDYPAWVPATIAEAYFGLGRYDHALRFIERYKQQSGNNPWEIRAFGQQLFSIAYLQQVRHSLLSAAVPPLSMEMPPQAGPFDEQQISDCLAVLGIAPGSNAIERSGKTGLAFSGGGFRASLFEIGTLAAMAERDELRNIEVISCVSGGSIIGAYYYLQLKLLLEEKADAEITKDDYIRLVKETEQEFLRGIQPNLRMRIFSNFSCNLRMLSKDYSRTHRLGELYEKFLYRPIFERHVARKKEQAKKEGKEYVPGTADELTGPKARPIYMSDLLIVPEAGFSLAADNWKRRNKVPQLILNATSVNTGHNWQFTASWMGEPAAGIIGDIDVKSRLRRMYYSDAPGEAYQRFRLGYAVGASSCVPVMFEPLPMNDLYPGIDLQLIDGGLHDNQGIASILSEECKNVFVCDGSGQLPTDLHEVSGMFALFMRADNILQERLRELQYLDLRERRSTTLINRLADVHLKNGIAVPAVNWKDCTDPPRTISPVPAGADSLLLPYGTLRSVQQLLSEIRTDLDAFHDTEAYALMYNGYAQTHYELSAEDETEFLPPASDWKFSAIAEYMKEPAKAEQIRRRLSVASRVPFKLYALLSKPWKIVLGGVLLALAVVLAVNCFAAEVKTWKIALLLAFLFAARILRFFAALLNIRALRDLRPVRFAVAIVSWIVFNAYLLLFNGIYLRIGKLKEE